MIKIYDRANKKYIDEEQFGQDALNFLYNNALGRIILKIAVNPVISKLIGAYKKSRISKRGIKSLIKDYDIDMSLYEEKEYKSFNDFFTRKIKLDKRPMIDNDNYFISPADSKVIAYDISKTNTFNIKGTEYTLNELVKDNIDLSDFQNGLCLVFRLSLDNYHHYCYPATGKLETTIKIKGKLHTVSSISKDFKIFKENKRVVSVLNTDNFDDIIYIEVGALSVGEIVNNDLSEFTKGEEKGYFSLGGSTIILLVKDNVIKLDEDILSNSEKGIETKVNYREKIGEKIC